jgi:MFS family permease
MSTVYAVAYSSGALYVSFERALHASHSQLSLLFALTTCLYFLLGAVSGPLADRIGARSLVLIGAVCMGVGLATTADANSLTWVYLTLGGGVGLGVACVYVPMVGSVNAWYERRPNRASAIGRTAAAISLGTLVGAPPLAFLIGRHGWRAALVIVGIAAAALLGLAAQLTHRPPQTHRPARPDWDRVLRRTRHFRCLYASLILMAMPRFFPLTFLIPFAESHRIHGVVAALLVTCMGIGGLASRLAVGRITERFGALATYRWCTAGLAASYLIWLAAPPTMPWLITFALASGASYGGTVASCPLIVAEVYGSATLSPVLGVLLTANGFGALICLVGAGALIDATGYTAAIAAGALLSIASLCAVAPLRAQPAATP